MKLVEIIVAAIGEFIAYILFLLFSEGIGKLIRSIYYGVRKLITGKEREISELERIEKRYLYKKFKLRSDFNEQIPKGMRGTVLEIIDEQNMYVEFENTKGLPFIDVDEQVFKIERKRIILENVKLKH
ncbi:hypothetical protein KMW28_24015 [Flammeovirga yaeyamensis]|uniref:Uncharacterized protein n=1 Tax=Flammeovirga yaeyamensis TaxID=367791 RepID=A0AAX1ND66_9BACT|nr:hypothetical protein [Flammeovirga yaeyamensis]MBB3696554.1 hypothetical protein [Flammeovirga yaeyamensis]NMF33232.1 hypothetical protein [Flammeovirga yaeyamensis]QWG05489.1 hypothetical protein KMW28_24015 [Flammeovirga yaeyamensis]